MTAPKTSRRELTAIDTLTLGNWLTEKAADPHYEGIGPELLHAAAKDELKLETDASIQMVRNLARRLGLYDHFKAQGAGSKTAKLETRIQTLEDQLRLITERLKICESKWLEHIQRGDQR